MNGKGVGETWEGRQWLLRARQVQEAGVRELVCRSERAAWNGTHPALADRPRSMRRMPAARMDVQHNTKRAAHWRRA
jgi:hypothetical protein